MQTSDRFSRTQIILHWLVAALILFQFLFSDGMEHAWRAFERNTYTATDFTTATLLHIVVGVAVLLLSIWRLVLRLRFGVPAADPAEPPALRMIASAAQVVLYALLFAMPITGLMAWAGGIRQAGEWHQLAKTLLYVVVGLHVLGALVHHLWWRTDVLKRMLGMA